ncbi:MAG: hypothetical protein QM831_22975 [Kofleriaceae bacterium]
MNKAPLMSALAIVAAAMLILSCFFPKWLMNEGTQGSVSMGLLSTTECGVAGIQMVANPTDCVTTDNGLYAQQWKDIQQPSSPAFSACGKATLVVALLAALGLLGAAALGFIKKKPYLKISPSTIALVGLMLGFITGCVFVATKPGPNGFVGIGISFWIFGAGSVLGLVSAIQLSKLNRPVDPDLLDDSMNPADY